MILEATIQGAHRKIGLMVVSSPNLGSGDCIYQTITIA
jgi:hypothetical protein